MHIKVVEVEGTLVVSLAGNIRTNEDYAAFKETIDSALDEGKTKLILNFAEVGFVNSSGLGRLVLASKKAQDAGGAIHVTNLTPELRELFAFTRLDAKIPVFPSVEDATAAFA